MPEWMLVAGFIVTVLFSFMLVVATANLIAAKAKYFTNLAERTHNENVVLLGSQQMADAVRSMKEQVGRGVL